MKLEKWLGPASVLPIVASLASLEFALNSMMSFREHDGFGFSAWLAGAVLAFALAAMVEKVKGEPDE